MTAAAAPRILAVRQPNAERIIRGEKPLEFRSWEPPGGFRGPLLILAAQSRADVTPADAAELPSLQYGGIVGIVDLADVFEMREAAKRFTRLRLDPLDGGYAWELRNPRRLPFYQLKGRLGLWTADDATLAALGLEAK